MWLSWMFDVDRPAAKLDNHSGQQRAAPQSKPFVLRLSRQNGRSGSLRRRGVPKKDLDGELQHCWPRHIYAGLKETDGHSDSGRPLQTISGHCVSH